MRKEIELYRSNLYAIIMLVISLLFLATAIVFFVIWIEWSLPVIIVSFLLFIVFLLCFILLYVKKTAVIYVTKKEIAFLNKEEKIISLDTIESVEIKTNISMLTILVKTTDESYEYSCFVYKLKEKQSEFIEVLKNLGINIECSSTLLAKIVD